MRSSLGVRERVWLRIQLSGTRQRTASSAESMTSALLPGVGVKPEARRLRGVLVWALFPLFRDIIGTSGVSEFMFSVT
jgi:hypothetical protein